MHPSPRFLAGGLATMAVASAVTLAAPTAFAAEAADAPCGQPGVPAVIGTVVREPVLQLLPAVSHEEWRWQRDVTTVDYEYTRLVSAAHSETDWVRPGSPEYQWSRTVIDRPGVDAVPGTDAQGHYDTVVVTPAVTATLVEYVQQQTGTTRWEDAGWNGEKADEDDGKGWVRTGASRVDVVTPAVTDQVWVVDRPGTPGTPAVPELSHVEYAWSPTSPGVDWSGPLDSRFVGGPQSATTTGDDVPDGPGWTSTARREVPADFQTLWADAAPDGFTATGASRPDVTTVQTTETSATSPAGAGWTTVPGSQVTVIDQPARTVILSPGSVEQVEIRPAHAATPACDAPTTLASPVVASASTGSSSTVSGAHAASEAHAAPADHSPSQVLPETGNPVSPLLLTAGLGSLLAGGVLVQLGRRRRTD